MFPANAYNILGMQSQYLAGGCYEPTACVESRDGARRSTLHGGHLPDRDGTSASESVGRHGRHDDDEPVFHFGSFSVSYFTPPFSASQSNRVYGVVEFRPCRRYDDFRVLHSGAKNGIYSGLGYSRRDWH